MEGHARHISVLSLPPSLETPQPAPEQRVCPSEEGAVWKGMRGTYNIVACLLPLKRLGQHLNRVSVCSKYEAGEGEQGVLKGRRGTYKFFASLLLLAST